jgi:hypothetical protein
MNYVLRYTARRCVLGKLAGVVILLAAGVAALAGEQVVKDFPPTFDWPDRRPIGTIFLAKPNQDWPANPRGYLDDPKMDVHTDAGKAQLRKRLLETADRCIRNLKDVGAQGMLVWDIEGEEKNTGTYLGDPRFLPKGMPEMDAVADEFFKKFRDAGLRTGVCIRPSRIIFKDPKNPKKYPWINGPYGHIDDQPPVDTLADKIAYAKKRWGCTLFYMDTNHIPMLEADDQGRLQYDENPDGTLRHGIRKNGALQWRMLDSGEMRQLHRKHPDVLICPEFQEPGYFASMSGYREFHKVGDFSADVRRLYPNAFRVWMCRMPADAVRAQFDAFVSKGAMAGEVFLFESWYDNAYAKVVKDAMAEAARRKGAGPTKPAQP